MTYSYHINFKNGSASVQYCQTQADAIIKCLQVSDWVPAKWYEFWRWGEVNHLSVLFKVLKAEIQEKVKAELGEKI